MARLPPNRRWGRTGRYECRGLTAEEVSAVTGSHSASIVTAPRLDMRGILVMRPLRKPGLRAADRVFGMEPAAFPRMLYRLKLPPELAALRIHPHMLRHACGFDLVGRADDL